MKYEIVRAAAEDRDDILALYKAQIGRDFCPWNEEYPSNETIDWDISRDALFVLKMNGSIKAAVSIEEDEIVDQLSCWDGSLVPKGELARLAVHPDEQNKGLGRIMMQFGMDELKARGFKGIRILVKSGNPAPISTVLPIVSSFLKQNDHTNPTGINIVILPMMFISHPS